MPRHFPIVIAMLFAVLTTLGFASDCPATTKAAAKSFMAKLEKAGAFDAKAKDIEPHNPQLADGAYFAVMRAGLGKRGRLQFKRGGPTSKAVMAVVATLVGQKAATE